MAQMSIVANIDCDRMLGSNSSMAVAWSSSPCLKSLPPGEQCRLLRKPPGTTHMVNRAVPKQGNPAYNVGGPGVQDGNPG
jgi:hypothetical protein